jgi:hypothetical protein
MGAYWMTSAIDPPNVPDEPSEQPPMPAPAWAPRPVLDEPEASGLPGGAPAQDPGETTIPAPVPSGI